MSLEKKPGIGFSFSKTKTKTTISQPSLSAFNEGRQQSTSNQRIELITSLEGKRVNVVDDGSGGAKTSKQAVVIPLIPNREIIKKKEKSNETTTIIDEKLSNAKIGDDLEAVRALMKATEEKKSKENSEEIKISSGGEK